MATATLTLQGTFRNDPTSGNRWLKYGIYNTGTSLYDANYVVEFVTAAQGSDANALISADKLLRSTFAIPAGL
jgi:hypothetical protein